MIELQDDSLKALVRIKHQYGQEVVQPVCPIAQEFANIAGTKILTTNTIQSMKKLGYILEVEQTLPKSL